jgi:hypothetical protein
MTKLKNTFGFSSSLIDAIKSVYEAKTEEAPGTEARRKIENVARPTGSRNTLAKQTEIQRKIVDEELKGNQHKLDVAAPKGKLTKADFDKLRKMRKEEVDNIEEADKTYPFNANKLAPIMVQLRSLIKFLAGSGLLKSLMREEKALYQVYMGEEFSEQSVENMLEEALELLEGRPKGSKNKSKMASAAPSPAKKTSSDDDEGEEEEAPAYKPASGKDVEHVMPQLAGAVDAGGRHITTAKGPKYVSAGTASKIHKHLMGLKAPDRAEASSKIYHMDDSHPAVKAIHADHEAAVKRGIKTPGEKRGRGRPKKNA